MRQGSGRNLIVGACVCGLLVLCGLGSARSAPSATGLSFVDEFVSLSKKRWLVSNGWTNGKYQNCTWLAEQVKVVDGTLRLSFSGKRTAQRAHACGEIQSKQRFGYGVYEARMKAVRGSGFNTAFFTYIGPVSKEPWHEIDFEVLGRQPSQVQLNQYVDGKGGNEKVVDVPGGADKDFHDYAFIWEKDRLRYYIDNVLVQTVNDPEKLPARPMMIFFSLWASDTLSGWLGKFSDPGGPVEAVVERVSYTALGDACQYPESLVCRLD
ncbi:MAG: family 16 glycosylhydrolase [Kiloniellaceae bacterium]